MGIFILFFSLTTIADPPSPDLPPAQPCEGKVINPVDDICWDCEFPITFGSSQDSGPDWAPPDTENPDESTCVCGEKPPRLGVPLGYWEPIELVDVTRSPGCMVSLGGEQESLSLSNKSGSVDAHGGTQNSSFFQVHGYRVPIISMMLGVLKDGHEALPGTGCSQGGMIPLPNYLSELDPGWNDETLASLWFPEAYLLGNVYSQVLCTEDALAANTGLPNNLTYWCAGSQGIIYPFTGDVTEHASGVQGSVLIAERMTMYLHRWPAYFLCMIKDTSANELCGESCNPEMPKSRYRYQMIYPVATTQKHGCLPFGRSTTVWEVDYRKLFPTDPDDIKKKANSNTENYAYLIWRKRNCCDF